MKIYTKFYADTVVVKRVGWAWSIQENIILNASKRIVCVLTGKKTSQSMKFTFSEKKVSAKIIHVFIF